MRFPAFHRAGSDRIACIADMAVVQAFIFGPNVVEIPGNVGVTFSLPLQIEERVGHPAAPLGIVAKDVAPFLDQALPAASPGPKAESAATLQMLGRVPSMPNSA